MKTVHVVVTGTVQGVSFRATCRQKALSLGVSGWVRNREDGSVEGVFSGEPDAVDGLIDWCRAGPDAARVASVAVDRLDHRPADLADRFEVR